ncbi:Serine threonine-kinase cot-1 [Hyphodiscus hymeniophilus]|uniref:Serine threonine-kinase cot-1 n=1 Tax=Hyphodiscus hymeniophilus TaxID=353542 RepID=A0A9P6VL91_9HELO|nr:Serine threonine-kinase cot-1 [Hyphodiscus hymeniophilus]
MENNNTNRLYLNLGEKFAQDTRQNYPTTPSTFPNPIFPSQGQGAQQAYAQNSQPQPYSTGFAPSGYFTPINNPYPAGYPAQPPQSSYQQAPQAPQATYQQRPPPANNDATNGLVHQFSHQNLGGGGRQSPYGQRQPSPAQRPRTAGAPGQSTNTYGNYLNAPMPPQIPQQQAWPEFQTAPSRDPDRYGSMAQNNQKKCERMASDFFKDSVKRARDRNLSGTTREDAPEMSLPFIGYTFKRFDNNFR